MKAYIRFILIKVVFLCFFVPNISIAQDNVPHWFPTQGFKPATQHIYFPEHNFYYDLNRKVYIYVIGGQWQISPELPPLFDKVDYKNAVLVELVIDTDSPHKHNSEHIVKYHIKHKHKHKRKESRHHHPGPHHRHHQMH